MGEEKEPFCACLCFMLLDITGNCVRRAYWLLEGRFVYHCSSNVTLEIFLKLKEK